MPRLPRVLVGILYSGEPQLPRALQSVLDQVEVEIGYFVICHRAKDVAHNDLFSIFRDVGSRFDARVKLDADMEITNPRFLRQLVEELRAEPRVALCIVPVWDFFTDGSILGLHAYGRGAHWSERREPLFTDTPDVANSQIRVRSVGGARAVLHSHRPTPFQSYHFGVHRGMKIAEARRRGRSRYVRSHLRNALRLIELVRHDRDTARSYALAGMIDGLAEVWPARAVSYTDPTLADHFASTLSARTPREVADSSLGGVRALLLRHPWILIIGSPIVLKRAVGVLRPNR